MGTQGIPLLPALALALPVTQRQKPRLTRNRDLDEDRYLMGTNLGTRHLPTCMLRSLPPPCLTVGLVWHSNNTDWLH